LCPPDGLEAAAAGTICPRKGTCLGSTECAVARQLFGAAFANIALSASLTTG
jgi:hypothetical protein